MIYIKMDVVANYIAYYFLLGLSYEEIMAFLTVYHKQCISLSTVKRILKIMGLYRKKYFTPLPEVLNFIAEQVEKYGQLHGYRWMHLKCIQQGFVITNRSVRIILKELDPIGVSLRSRRRLRRRKYSTPGPNFLWHLDSYDKLKPYGIAINGAIDGYSRYIIWLQAGRTASDPKVIGGYFITGIETFKGVPCMIRGDFGTENGHVETFQNFLRDRQNSFIYGTSQLNQRIEAWWSILRKHCAQFWMNLFQQIKEDGFYSGTFLDKSLIQFCFLHLIQDELAEVVTEWNSHLIAKSRNAISPRGRPTVMFHLPELYGTQNYLKQISEQRVDVCKDECVFHHLPCETDIFELCKIIFQEKNLNMPTNPYEAVDNYISLRNEILSSFN